MLSTLKKRIVFCGNYRFWYPEWRFLDEDNSNMDWYEFFGEKHMNENIFVRPHQDSNVATNRMKLNRVIDESEYVIRCDFGKTSNPTSGFAYGESSSPSYGNRTDIIGFWGNYYRHPTCFSQITAKDSRVSHNHFNDLSVRKGIPSEHLKDFNLNSNMNESEIEATHHEVLKNYGCQMVASQMDEWKSGESWLNMNYFYRRVLDPYCDEHKDWPNTKVFYDKTLSIVNEFIEYTQDVHGLNTKYLKFKDYINLCEEVKYCSVSYDELKELIFQEQWARKIFNFDFSNTDWMKTEDERLLWMDEVKGNFHVNRGLELIWMMLTDSRFDDYDKYIIGTMGINECFRIGTDCLINQWGEYLWMSKKIKEGKLRYLPTYVDGLYNEYNRNGILVQEA